MEADHPVFIDVLPLSDLVKRMLEKRGVSSDFCYGPFQGPDDVTNPLIGKRIRLVLEIED